MKKHIVGGLILPELAPKNDQRYPEPPVRFIQESVRDFFLEACVDRLNHLVMKGTIILWCFFQDAQQLK